MDAPIVKARPTTRSGVTALPKSGIESTMMREWAARLVAESVVADLARVRERVRNEGEGEAEGEGSPEAQHDELAEEAEAAERSGDEDEPPRVRVAPAEDLDHLLELAWGRWGCEWE